MNIDHDVRDRLTMVVGSYATVLPLIELGRFGLVICDADHTYEAMRDAFKLLVPGSGMRRGSDLAVHDHELGNPGVQRPPLPKWLTDL